MPHDRRNLERLAALAEPARRELYLFVDRSAEPVSRDQAASALGIGRAVAAFHLDKLVDAGLLEAHYRRLSGRRGPGAGRPAKVYRVSRRPIEVSLPPRRYELLGRLLAQAFDRADGHTLASADDSAAAARQYGRELGAHARRGIRARATEGRLRACFMRTLEAIGYQPRATDGAITFGNCPFHAVAREYPGAVCGVNLALVQGVAEGIGAQARAEPSTPPDPCCVVVALPDEARESADRQTT